MSEEIRVGDWIRFRSSGRVQRGKVVGMDRETYTIQPEGHSGGVTVVGRGGDEKKIAPPEEE